MFTLAKVKEFKKYGLTALNASFKKNITIWVLSQQTSNHCNSPRTYNSIDRLRKIEIFLVQFQREI